MDTATKSPHPTPIIAAAAKTRLPALIITDELGVRRTEALFFINDESDLDALFDSLDDSDD